MKTLTLKDSVVSGAVAAVTFAVSFALGGAITAVAGPGSSGIVTIVATTVIVIVGAKIVDRFGALTLIVTIFSILAIPTNMFGPPGVQKILIGLTTGVVYDLVAALFRRRNVGYILAGGISSAYAIVAIYFLLRWLGLPGADRIAELLVYILPLYAALGFLGGWLGVLLFDKRLARLASIQRLR